MYPEQYIYKLPGVTLENVNDKGTRYNACSTPKYKEVLQRGQDILADYLEDQRVLNEDDKDATDFEKNKLATDRRLDRELKHGPLSQ